NEEEQAIAERLNSEVIYYYGVISTYGRQILRNTIEEVISKNNKKKALSIILTTPGGIVEEAEKIVEIIRHHFKQIYFIVPNMAMSAGTILCMSGNKIYMDYASSLGPIDPQVLGKDGKFLPALGYLDKVSELIEKSRDNTITPAEYTMLQQQDLAKLRLYEQARELSETLLREWLVKYKFSDWTTHSEKSQKKERGVTNREKKERAEEIAKLLSDNKKWHSHGRMISKDKLESELKLKIEDLNSNKQLSSHVRLYNDTLTDYLQKQNVNFYVHNRHINSYGE
ncbi:MAG: ATP-dependent Clp protease proteolytic subunit, partial [Pseudomonadota bacterium]